MDLKRLSIKDSELVHLFKYYGIFSVIYILANTAVVSIIAFFHFLLEHDMSVIENWIYRNNWEIMVLCKVISLYIIIKFLEIRIYGQRFIFKFLKNSTAIPKHHIFITLFFLMSFILALGKVQYISDNSKYTSYHLISFIASFIYFSVDYFLLFFLKSQFRIQRKWEVYTFIFLSSMLFVITSSLTIPHENQYMIYLFLHFITMLIFTFSANPNLIVGFSYCLLFVSPLTSLIGLDPVWADQFSLFQLSNPLPFLYVFSLWAICFSYLFIIRGKRLVD